MNEAFFESTGQAPRQLLNSESCKDVKFIRHKIAV